MASNGTNQQVLVSLFKGENYRLWSLKMKTMFRSQEHWDIVENGFEDVNPAKLTKGLRENRKKEAQALYFIQMAVNEDILSRISAANTSHVAWEIIKVEYMGDKKAISIKLQNLRHQFESLLMEERETMQEYLARVSAIVNQMKSYGEFFPNETVVSKVLRSLTKKFEYVVSAIMEANDISSYSFDTMLSSLIGHEDRLGKTVEKHEAKAFHMKGEYSGEENGNGFQAGGGPDRSGGRGEDRGRDYYDNSNNFDGPTIEIVTRAIFNVIIARSMVIYT